MAMQKLMKVAWFGTKGAIVGGAVYVSIDQAIWTETNHVKLQETIRNIKEMLPGDLNVAENIPTAIVDPINIFHGLINEYLPKKDDVNVNFRSYWNAGVFWTFGTIADLPSKVIGLKDSLFQFASPPPPLPVENSSVSETVSADVAPEKTELLEVVAVEQETQDKE